MPFESRRAKLMLGNSAREELTTVSRSRTEAKARVERAQILLRYADGESVSAIARTMHTNRPKIERTIDRALQWGVLTGLTDLPRQGRPRKISMEDRTWVVALACQKPKELGYAQELWTTRLLAEHVRSHCEAAGHPSLARLARGTVSKILARNKIRPHKISYYLERRDPEFETKMAQVLHVYKRVELLLEKGAKEEKAMTAVLSYDEKPGMQALGNKAPDLPPVPGSYSGISRDSEYIRHGTLSLLAGIDLLTGEVLARVEQRHRSCEFIEWLKMIDVYYPNNIKIQIVLDNHSVHISKETRKYLAGVPNRFDFIFTPKHGSWLNLIEVFFSKLSRVMLRGLRVDSLDELKTRLEQYFEEINQTPVIFRWKYGLESIEVV